MEDLEKAMMAHHSAGIITVEAEDFVVNSPNNTVIGHRDVIGLMEQVLHYREVHEHIIFVAEKPEVTVGMGYDDGFKEGAGAGKQVMRPFSDFCQKSCGAEQPNPTVVSLKS
jgi:hypothetical protein